MANNKKVTYRGMRLRQKHDLKSNKIVNSIYRNNFSTFIAYIFVKLGISPNAITISNFFVCIFGFIFASIGTFPYIFVGLFLFILFMTLDYTDGEVARATNKQSLEGLHFEFMQDYIYYCCLGIGLGIGLFRLYQSEIYLYLGFLLTFTLIVEYATTSLLKSISRKGVIDNKIKMNISDSKFQKKLRTKFFEGHSWKNRNIFLKLFGIYPAGLVFTLELIAPILIVLSLIEFFLGIYINFPITIYGQIVGIMPFYLFIFSIIKLIGIINFVYKMETNRHITNFLKQTLK